MEEKRYIEREATIAYAPLPKHLREYQTMNLDDAWEDGYDFAIRQIESIPAADVRPVVLCKDCIYAPSGTDDGEDQGFALEWPHDEWPENNPCPCKCEDGWYSYKPKPNFFCANGKVKYKGDN